MASKGLSWYEPWAREEKKSTAMRVRFPRHWREVFRAACRKVGIRRISVAEVVDFGGVMAWEMIETQQKEITPSQLVSLAAKSAWFKAWLRQDESAEERS